MSIDIRHKIVCNLLVQCSTSVLESALGTLGYRHANGCPFIFAMSSAKKLQSEFGFVFVYTFLSSGTGASIIPNVSLSVCWSVCPSVCLSVCLSVRGKNFYMKEMFFAYHTFQVSLTQKCKIILILAHVYFPPSQCLFPLGVCSQSVSNLSCNHLQVVASHVSQQQLSTNMCSCLHL